MSLSHLTVTCTLDALLYNAIKSLKCKAQGYILSEQFTFTSKTYTKNSTQLFRFVEYAFYIDFRFYYTLIWKIFNDEALKLLAAQT